MANHLLSRSAIHVICCLQRSQIGALGLLLLLATTIGCSTPKYLAPRDVRENALTNQLKLVGAKGPEISPRTWDTLKRFGLVDEFKQNSRNCFGNIREIVNKSPDPELIYALSELAYVEGKKAERRGDDYLALMQFGVALTNSYDYLFSEDLKVTRNEYDPQFRDACELYNESLEDLLRLLCADHKLEPGQTYSIKTPDRTFLVKTEMRGQWRPDEFDHFEFVSDYEIETLRNRHINYGLGVPLIAVRRQGETDQDHENYYPKGLSYAVTAMMRCVAPKDGARAGEANTCILEIFDPLSANQIELAQRWVPLETDLTTPLAFFLDSPEFRRRNRATEGLLNPHGSQDNRGLYMLEPYDPDRIPVLMVHGLWSSPMTWMDMFNDLRSFPEVRQRYQFWFYLYPSGQPFWISAANLRNDLIAMRDKFDPGHRHTALDQMVLVGHSMGGLVSRMQTIESEDSFWKIISDQPAGTPDQAVSRIRGDRDDRNKLVSTLFFKPNQSVRRVITIGTPHRGSEFANDFTRWLARRLIKLPTMNVSVGQRLAKENPELFKHKELLTVANAIDSLAPESPIFPVMLRASRSPDVKYHNIIGVLDEPSIWQRQIGPGDGVVEYTSAKMDDVESELVVNADHVSIHMTGKAIFEVRRILMEHLDELDADDRVAKAAERLAEKSSPADDEDVPVVIER